MLNLSPSVCVISIQIQIDCIVSWMWVWKVFTAWEICYAEAMDVLDCWQGHTIGAALTGGGGGGGHSEAAPAPQQQPASNQPMSTQQQQSPCQFELKQFTDCAQTQHDITLCQSFNEVLKDCRLRHGNTLKIFLIDKSFGHVNFNYFYDNMQSCGKAKYFWKFQLLSNCFYIIILQIFCLMLDVVKIRYVELHPRSPKVQNNWMKNI